VVYKLGAPGRHLVQNSLAVMGAVALLGGDLARAALALAGMKPPKGRGQRHTLRFRGGQATLIDEAYNANPASMRAVIALLGQAKPGGRGRRIAVLGDMLELGADGPAMHAGLAGSLEEARVDLVFAAGPLMRSLWDALPSARRGGYAESATGLEPQLVSALVPGDVLMVKGSNASGMGRVVDALLKRFASAEPDPDAEAADQRSAVIRQEAI
jgi:UDP-N-acetylmuramoyl-tripeptide--D-alanyl-D-alanine ligase